MNIHNTTDYAIFKNIASNREIDMQHVAKLTHSIVEKNLLQINPIIVDSEFNVIDGQHRLEAAKILKVPIFYIESSELTDIDMHRINSNMKNWTNMDFVNYWTIKKQPGFDVLSRMINKYPHIPFTSMMQLLSDDLRRDTKSLRSGIVDVSEIKRAERVISQLTYYRDMGLKEAFSSQFIITLAIIDDVPEFDFERMQAAIKIQPRSLVKCINIKQYKQMLEDIYNRGLHEKNRLRF
jgi:hypothetical protein